MNNINNKFNLIDYKLLSVFNNCGMYIFFKYIGNWFFVEL